MNEYMDDRNMTFGDILKLISSMPPELRENTLQEMESNAEFVIDLDNNDHGNRDNNILKAKDALDRVLNGMPYILKDESVDVRDRGRLMALVASMQWAQSVMNEIRETNTINVGSYIRVAYILEDLDEMISYLKKKYPGKIDEQI